MGPIEQAVRAEIPNRGALGEVAYVLAESLDLRSGGSAAAKELRTLLELLKKQQPKVDHKEARKQRLRDGNWAMMQEGEWEWSDEQDDWVRVD